MAENGRQSEGVQAEEPRETAARPEDPAALAEQLSAIERELEAAQEQLLRAHADMDNLRKRAARDVEAAHKYGLERLVAEMLPVKDSLELGVAAAREASSVDALLEGFELTLKKLDDALAKLGVSEVDPAGERFDPQFHQAMTTEVREDVTPGTVVRVVQKGYLLNDRLLRPALVVVSAAPATEDEAGERRPGA